MRISGFVRRVYRATVPEPIRLSIGRARRHTPDVLYGVRWHLAPRRYLERWTEERLKIGECFWLFILGCNNSGTTLLTQILDNHPSIRTLPKEGQRLTKAIPNSAPCGVGRVFTQRMDLFRWTEESDASSVPRLRYDWACRFRRRSGILLEKSPPNTLRSRWLQRHFRPARFLVLVRNPYAVCEGIARRRGHSMTEAATHWRLVHEVLEEDMKYLDRCLLVRYEDICEQPEKELQAIERFLDLAVPFDRTLLDGNFGAHNMDGVPHRLQNFNSRSLQRLPPHDIETVTRIIGSQMLRYGYAPLNGNRAAS